ncbi:lipoyl(octanoyl) transferase LipB [Alloacidobacterium dinghuense]|uniref:Octanoyltransferase n=1 Tax=Alloacidobacterium dinghuense TaxID=2763107 RepID=A0A7G8BGD6_9BACT|nr:lipoyl(octanoyl) transferase LipB [Alloacidobacterium dinghuense]QNI31606.1 lipoyl(octanoyl) transferase LipB [Alloacidobacterium dinghuense]
MVLSVLYLGRLDYATGLALQKTLVGLRHQQRIGNVLLLLEHPPVLTLGRNSNRSNILASDELLTARGVEVHEINRGGDVTYHGPGQLVGYPILDLRSFSPRVGAVDYVRKLEEVLIRACGEFGVPAQRIAGRTGVWTLAGGSIRESKISAIGVHISRGITSHGFALNVTTDLRDFNLIVPCGIVDRDVTSLERELDASIDFEKVMHSVSRYFGQVFDHQTLWLESLDDLLPNPAKSPAQDTPLSVPSEIKRLRDVKESHFA